LLEETLVDGSRPEGIRIEGATESGNAEKLADHIMSADGGKRRLLYLTGDKNRDTLPNKINESSSNIELVPLQVYATCEDSLLKTEILEYGEDMREGAPFIDLAFRPPK
jgi:uroporphyrinogen-III synthase